ncbi:MAG TPA: shikimate dehydrogenase [Verrucomicrobiae bacterium]
MPEPMPPPVNAATRFCAVLGHPVKHSASPAMQNAGIAALKLNWRYLACDVHPENLREAIAGAKAMKFIGLNLTVPHKLLALEMMDELDASARTWGAVNTIHFEARGNKVRAIGFNTDADAITRSLREDLGVKLRGAKVLLLGAGGAGRTAALKLASEKVVELFLVNRTKSKAVAVAREIHRRFPKVKTTVGYPKGDVDLLLNATTLGLKAGDPLPFDAKSFSLRQARAVYDMIYRPPATGLLCAAKAAGCKTANGLGMLLHQGAKALEIWSGKRAPVEVMRRALEAEVYGKR